MTVSVKPPAEREAVQINPDADKPTFEGTTPGTGKRKKERLVWLELETEANGYKAWREVKGQPTLGHGQAGFAESWLRRNVADGLLPAGTSYRLIRVVIEDVTPRLVHKVAVAL